MIGPGIGAELAALSAIETIELITAEKEENARDESDFCSGGQNSHKKQPHCDVETNLKTDILIVKPPEEDKNKINNNGNLR